jgi:hypothetical protein
MELAEMGFGIA